MVRWLNDLRRCPDRLAVARGRANSTLADLRGRAEAIADSVAIVQRRAHKPVIFTEVGFKSIRGTSVRPWEWPRRKPAELLLSSPR